MQILLTTAFTASRDAHGKRISRNVYAHTREECEEKLAAMIEEMKQEIAAEKEKLKAKV